jgi:hypothetical protein
MYVNTLHKKSENFRTTSYEGIDEICRRKNPPELWEADTQRRPGGLLAAVMSFLHGPAGLGGGGGGQGGGLLSHGLSMWLYIVLFLASNNTVYSRVM